MGVAMNLTTLVVVSWLAGSVCPAQAAPAPRYRVTDLSPLDVTGVRRPLNDRGEVIGYHHAGRPDARGNSAFHTFLCEQGKIYDIGTVHGFRDTDGVAINNRGQIAGLATAPDGNVVSFLWLGGHFRLPPPYPGASQGEQTDFLDLNDIEQTIVYVQPTYKDGNGPFFNLIWDKGVYHRVEDATTESVWINNKGHVLWWTGTTYRLERNGVVTELGKLTPAGTSSDAFMEASAFNNQDEIIGNLGTDASLWSKGRLIYLHRGWSETYALSINDQTQVVGYFDYPPNKPYTRLRTTEHAFLWQSGRMYDLNSLIPATSDWVLSQAVAVNNHGQIVGTGKHRGKYTAFLLTPQPKRMTVREK